MNFLELCQAVVREGAIIPGDGKPTTVEGQTGRMRLVVDWVNRANRDVQATRDDFSFRVRAVDFLVTEDDDYVRMIDTHDDIESINEMTVSIRNASGLNLLAPISWSQYRYMRLEGITTTTGLPEQYSVDTMGDIHLIPKPLNECIMRTEVKLSPQTMSKDDDVSYVPPQYHDAIIYRALMYFYEYDESANQYETASRHFSAWMNRLIASTTELNNWNNTQTGETQMVISCD